MIDKFKRLIKKNIQEQQRVTMMAFIIRGGSIQSIGVNDYYRKSYSHKEENSYSEYTGLHAELDAIRKCRKDKLNGSIIVVLGLTKANNLVKSSKPCESCMNAIKSVGINRIVFFDNNGRQYTKKI